MPEKGSLGESVLGNFADMAFGTAGGVISSLINNAFYERNLNLQVNKQKQLFDYQNAYNTPSAQMQRLSEAGLNPNLVYGNSSQMGSASMPSAPTGVANPGNYNTGHVIAGMLQLQQMKAAEAQTNLYNAEARKTNLEANKQEEFNKYYPELVQIQIKQASKDLERTAAEIGLIWSNNSLNTAKAHLTVAQEALTRGEITLQEFERQKLVAETMAFFAAAEEHKAHASLLNEMEQTQKAETLLKNLDLTYKRLVLGNGGKSMKDMADAERNARIEKFKEAAAVACRNAGIKGNKVLGYIDWYMNHVEKVGNTLESVSGFNIE